MPDNEATIGVTNEDEMPLGALEDKYAMPLYKVITQISDAADKAGVPDGGLNDFYNKHLNRMLPTAKQKLAASGLLASLAQSIKMMADIVALEAVKQGGLQSLIAEPPDVKCLDSALPYEYVEMPDA